MSEVLSRHAANRIPEDPPCPVVRIVILFPRSAGRRAAPAAEGWGEASRRAASPKKQLEGNVEMTKKLAMTGGTARRGVRNLALLAAVAVAIGARAERETGGGYT